MRALIRWIVRIIAGLLVLILLVALAGAVFQTVASRSGAKKFPPPGRMIPVGDHALHALIKGDGGPTVVFDSALGASHLSWSLVQPAVSGFTRACAYDRAGIGWSEPGPKPRTSGRAVDELREMLRKAGLNPPYVLVGNSIGGLNMRLYALRYPGEVAGLVLVDSVHEDQDARLPASARLDPSFVKTLSLFRWGTRIGLPRVMNMPLGEGSSPLLPAELKPAARAAGFRNSWIDATYRETVGLEASYTEVRSARKARPDPPLGDLPLIVLGRGLKPDETPDGEKTLKIWTELQKELAAESRRGEFQVVDGSGHFIQAERPEAVIAAIRKIVDLIRGLS